jgi:hypothetical protein
MTLSGLPVRRAIATAALTCTAALITGCSGSSTPAARPAATVSRAAHPTAAAAATTPAGSAPSTGSSTGAAGTAPAAAPTTQAGPQPCTASALRATTGSGEGAAGSSYYPIDFTNAGGASCTLYGYPGVSFVTGAGGSQIGAAATRNTTVARQLVTLAPGAVAHATLQVVNASNYPPSKCSIVGTHWLQVYPPGQITALYISFASHACSGGPNATGILSVQVVQPGATGS